MGRKSIPILLKATSPEGETKRFTSIGEAAKELGFSERGIYIDFVDFLHFSGSVYQLFCSF